LLCGDSTKADDVARLMDGAVADVLFTDPPYGVSFVGLKGSMYVDGKKKGANTAIEIKNDDLRGDDLSALFRDSISLAVTFCKNESAFYIFFAINRSLETLHGLEHCQLDIRNWLMWDKGNVGFHAMGAQYKPNYESFLYCHKKGFSPNWIGDQKQQTVWRHSVERLGLHPTMKPVELIKQALNNHASEIVLDIFGGSGSTLIASEVLNKASRLIEIDPKYCDVIIQRWENATGQKAVLDGR
jgi:DNA modification methylase